MRSLLLPLFALCLQPTAQAGECITACVGIRAAGGASLGGGQGESTWKVAPLQIGLQAEKTISEVPRVGLLGGLALETTGRLGVGARLGLRAHSSARVRFSGTVDYMFAPYTLLGVGTEVGTCRSYFGLPGSLCLDFRVSAHFLGDDLPDGKVLAQFGLVLGGEFDVD